MGGSTLKNIRVTAVGANPVVTGDDGQFTLRFPRQHPGEEVKVDVSRSGWVVINDIQLKRLLPADPIKSPLDILICKSSERERWALQYYRISFRKTTDAEYENKLTELKGRHAATEEERNRLRKERDQIREQVDQLAKQLISRPASGESESYQKAMALLLDNRLDEALNLLDEKRLTNQMDEAKKRHEEILQNWLLRAHILTMKFDFDGATLAYENALSFAPASFDAWFNYASFNEDIARFTKARNGYNKALSIARDRSEIDNIVNALTNLGGLDRLENHLAEARTSFAEVLNMVRTLARDQEIKSKVVYGRSVA